ncbi:MAG TPA: hypothetical protein VJ746_10105 [Nitrospira sp.]|nr:hypothetical protein [Nitrospira sp.]
MGHLSSDTAKFVTQQIKRTTATIDELRRAQERFKEAQQIEELRAELLRLWTLKRYEFIRRGDVPRSITTRMGELTKMAARATTFEDHQRILEAFAQLIAPYKNH